MECYCVKALCWVQVCDKTFNKCLWSSQKCQGSKFRWLLPLTEHMNRVTNFLTVLWILLEFNVVFKTHCTQSAPGVNSIEYETLQKLPIKYKLAKKLNMSKITPSYMLVQAPWNPKVCVHHLKRWRIPVVSYHLG